MPKFDIEKFEIAPGRALVLPEAQVQSEFSAPDSSPWKVGKVVAVKFPVLQDKDGSRDWSVLELNPGDTVIYSLEAYPPQEIDIDGVKYHLIQIVQVAFVG